MGDGENDQDEEDEKEPARIISEAGTEMMTLRAFGSEGDRLTIEGAVMGAWPSTMYMEAPDVGKLVTMFLHRDVLGYIVRLPYLLLRGRQGEHTDDDEEQDDRSPSALLGDAARSVGRAVTDVAGAARTALRATRA